MLLLPPVVQPRTWRSAGSTSGAPSRRSTPRTASRSSPTTTWTCPSRRQPGSWACHSAPAGGNPSPAASASPTSEASAAPSPTSTLPAAAYTCTTLTGGDSNSGTNVTDVRVGTSSGYDRFVIQFNGPVPQYTITPQGS